MAAITVPRWDGDFRYLLSNLVLKDFKIRYRNMSLGLAWSVANPMVMMLVLTFVFTKMFPNGIPNFPVFLLAGLVPFNFFSIGWATGTTSIVDNGVLLKRLSFPREIIPIASVFANCVHFFIQFALLLILALGFGLPVTVYWLWLPVLVALEIIFVSGLALITSAINVYIRDTRYVIESALTVLWWLVPIFYPSDRVPEQYRDMLYYNPVAAVITGFRNVLLEQRSPANSLLFKMTAVSFALLGIGLLVFNAMKKRFYNYL